MKDAPALIIRTEGGPNIGLGHVCRCLSLAIALRQQGTTVFFLTNDDPNVLRQVRLAGFEAIPVKLEADPAEVLVHSRKHEARIIIVDSYGFDSDHFRDLKRAGFFVVALDDLAAIELPVDMVINGSAAAEDLAYMGLKSTRLVLGPQFILLRPEFAGASRPFIKDQVERVLITLGGSDPHNLTPRIIRWTCEALGPVQVDVVVGPLFENIAEIARVADEQAGAVTLHHDPGDLRSLMLAADLAISGGGQTTYELAATGTPVIAIRLADNQTINLKGLSEDGALIWIGDVKDAELEAEVRSSVKALASRPEERNAMSKRAGALVDGLGAERAARAILDSASIF